MQEQTAGERLTDEHHRIDEGVDAALDGSGDLAGLAAALRLLREHIYLEEEVLFPPLVDGGLAMPVFVMKREHGQMWPLILHLEEACAAGADLAELKADLLYLRQQLTIHNPKEEQIVYSAADRLDAPDDSPDLAEQLAIARMPAAWRCAMAPRRAT